LYTMLVTTVKDS